MNILLTNDDGIFSEGLMKLAGALRAGGKHRVYIIAPDMNRSGISHALSILSSPVRLSSIGEDTWACSGYPAECIIIALKGLLEQQPDLVISGINKGANLGTDIIYSGTAAAARQASLSGIPAIALSLVDDGNYYWDMAAAWAVDHLEELLEYWSELSFVNVNIPNSQNGPKGIIATWPAIKDYNDTLSLKKLKDGQHYYFLEAGVETMLDESGTDFEAVSKNFVSVSPVYSFPAVIRNLCPGVPDHAAVAKRG